jgi:putative ABC transport system substrate-binding protein
MINKSAFASLLFLTILCNVLFAPMCAAGDIIIVADSRLAPAMKVIAGIRKTLHATIKVFAPAEVKGQLGRIVEREGPRAVIALGREALTEALRLPSTIPVIYDLVVTPPQIVRPNTTGFYMAVPARDYAELVRSHLRSIKKIAVVGRRDQLSILAGDPSQQTVTCTVRNAFELVDAVRHVEGADAILILPDADLLSATAIEEVFLISFRRGIPLLGISEKQVKDGALFALVVDTEEVGRQIGEYAAKAMRGKSIDQFPPSPPRKHELFLNTETARKMGIQLPEDMVRMAKRAYP